VSMWFSFAHLKIRPFTIDDRPSKNLTIDDGR